MSAGTIDRPGLDLRDVDPVRRSGVALDAITVAQRQHQRQHRRPAALTAREALAALQFEATLVFVAAGNVRHGVALTDEDMDRLAIACNRIDQITDEVTV